MLLPCLNLVNLHRYLEIRKGVMMNPEPHNTTTNMKVDIRGLAAVRSQAKHTNQLCSDSDLIVFVTNTYSYSRVVSVGSTLSPFPNFQATHHYLRSTPATHILLRQTNRIRSCRRVPSHRRTMCLNARFRRKTELAEVKVSSFRTLNVPYHEVRHREPAVSG